MNQRLRRLPFVLPAALAVAVAGTGCAGDDPDFPGPPPATEAGAPPRTISNVTPGADRTDAGRHEADAPVSAGDGAAAARVTVAIASPMTGALVPREARFAPSISVTTESSAPSAGDLLQDVTAMLIQLHPARKQVTMVQLNQVGLQSVPETNTLTYRFADTPLDLSRVESGRYELVVAARTSSGAAASATVEVLVDAGPTIRIDAPSEGKSFRGSAPVDVMVTDPAFGPVEDVRMTIGQTPIPLSGPSANGQYTATIDFASFDPPLQGEQLVTVRARNRNKTEAVAVRKFISDDKGPAITNTTPATGSLMGRVVTISAEVSDPAGVLESSVKVVVAHGDKNFEFPLMPPPPGSTSRTFTYLFDTSKLPINALFPSITFRASDVLGNESSVGYLVSLDNMPPLADLDPPDDFRVFFRPSGGSGLRCSWPFDPVGPEAVDDGGRASQLFDIRARIEDQGNDPRSGTADFTPISTVDKAELLIMDDTSRPLIVDSRRRADGPTPEGRRDEPDGYCDEVNPSLTISASAAASPDVLLITMAPMSPGGDVDGTVDPNATCDSGGGRAPEVKCATTYNAAKTRWDTTATPAIGHVDHMSSVISYANAGLPAIWTVPPVIEDKVQCAGRQFDALANNLKDGWACVAVRATDKLGNQQISRVLRLCIDHDGKGNECPHRSVASVSATSPMVVETRTPHGFKAGDAVLVSEVFPQTSANGRWTVQVVDGTRFTLVGSTGHAGLGPATTGLVVGAAELPDCTGTVTAVGPPATVDGSKACKPWRSYVRGETRVQSK